jgi:hypothetical protein
MFATQQTHGVEDDHQDRDLMDKHPDGHGDPAQEYPKHEKGNGDQGDGDVLAHPATVRLAREMASGSLSRLSPIRATVIADRSYGEPSADQDLHGPGVRNAFIPSTQGQGKPGKAR